MEAQLGYRGRGRYSLGVTISRDRAHELPVVARSWRPTGQFCWIHGKGIGGEHRDPRSAVLLRWTFGPRDRRAGPLPWPAPVGAPWPPTDQTLRNRTWLAATANGSNLADVPDADTALAALLAVDPEAPQEALQDAVLNVAQRWGWLSHPFHLVLQRPTEPHSIEGSPFPVAFRAVGEKEAEDLADWVARIAWLRDLDRVATASEELRDRTLGREADHSCELIHSYLSEIEGHSGWVWFRPGQTKAQVDGQPVIEPGPVVIRGWLRDVRNLAPLDLAEWAEAAVREALLSVLRDAASGGFAGGLPETSSEWLPTTLLAAVAGVISRRVVPRSDPPQEWCVWGEHWYARVRRGQITCGADRCRKRRSRAIQKAGRIASADCGPIIRA